MLFSLLLSELLTIKTSLKLVSLQCFHYFWSQTVEKLPLAKPFFSRETERKGDCKMF